MRTRAARFVLPLAIGWAQDERRVASPDGRLEFRIFVAQPADGESRLAGCSMSRRGRGTGRWRSGA